jgi:hypothetical protein
MRFESLEKRKLLSVGPVSTFDSLVDEGAVAEVGQATPGGEETQICLDDHPDLIHLLNNRAKSEEEWFLLLSGLVALMPVETPKTTGSVIKFAGSLIGTRPIHPLKRDSVNYALRNKPLLRERVGMVLPRERKRTKTEWITLLKSAVDSLPDGALATVSNIASYSNGFLTVQMIRNALMWHDIQAFKQGWMKREYEVPRSRHGWITLLKQAVAELPVGTPPTSNAIETLTFGQIKRTQIASALHRFDMPYREVGLAREVIVAKTREAWTDLLRDRTKAVPQGASPTPYHVGPLVYERNGAEIVRDTLWYYGIKYAEVDMVPLPLTRAEWLESIQRAKQNLKPDTSPVPRNVAASSRNEFTFQDLKHAMKPAGKGGFGITYEDAGLEREIRVKRSLDERIQMIKRAAQEIFDTTGCHATPQEVSELLNRTHDESFSASRIVSAIREAGVSSYEDLSMITSKHGPHVQVHSRAQVMGVQGEMLDGDEDGLGARFVAARSRSIAPDARLDVEDAIHRTRLRVPHGDGKLVDDVVAKLRLESDLLYDIDALAESLDRTPEQVQLALQALHEVFGEGSWDHTVESRAVDEEQPEAAVCVSNGVPEEDSPAEREPEGADPGACYSIPENGVPVDRLLRHIVTSLTRSPDCC